MTETKDDANLFSCPYSAGAEFDHVLEKAEALLQRAEVEEALNLLAGVEKSYVRAAKLFDLLGDALLRRGNTEEGLRYKTLHEVLKGTFKIATDEAVCSSGRGQSTADSDYASGLDVRPPEQEVCAPTDEGALAPCGIPEKKLKTSDFIPVTAAMGHEFIRQGHFDRALEIFTLLAARHPEDQSLQEGKEEARKKGGQNLVLEVLQRWLGNIERMKSSHPSEA
jgi:tetratricopeptide (TPR) repeat protein